MSAIIAAAAQLGQNDAFTIFAAAELLFSVQACKLMRQKSLASRRGRDSSPIRRLCYNPDCSAYWRRQ
jgi:hypothetical protein